MSNLSREYCAYFAEATEVWKRFVIGEVIVAIDEYRDSVCQTLQDAANSGPNASTGGGQDINNQEMFGSVLENAQQQAEQRIVDALNQTLIQPPPPPVIHSPVVSIIANQTAQVNPPGENVISQAGINSGQNDGDSLDVSIKREAESSSESECESDTDDRRDEVQVKEEPTEGEEDITGRSEEQTKNDNNFDDNHETNDYQMEYSNEAPNGQVSNDQAIDEEANPDDNMETDENELNDHQESDNEGSMIDQDDNSGEESDHFEEVNLDGVEESEGDSLMNDEDSTGDTTDNDSEEEQAAGPSTSTGRRTTRSVSKRQIVPNRPSKRQINVKKTEPLSVITQKLNCTVPGCKKVVKNKNALNSHLLTAHKLKRYRCLVRRCYGKVSTSFANQAQLSEHLDLVHGRTSRLACHCDKKFKSYSVLHTHYRKYHELGRFACSKDGCAFKPTSTRIKVQHHLDNHREVNHECPVDGCDKSFKKKGNLDRHTLTHTGERPFGCPECDKSFSLQYNLTVHLRMHRNDKCYKCTWPQCTYSATIRSNVITHIRMVHFELPRSKTQQIEAGIDDDRDPRDYLTRD